MLGSLRDKISKLPQPILVACIVLFALLGIFSVSAKEGLIELGQGVIGSVQAFVLESQENNKKQYSFKPFVSPSLNLIQQKSDKQLDSICQKNFVYP